MGQDDSADLLMKEGWKLFVFIGLGFFLAGICMWAKNTGLLSQEMLLPTIFMGLGALSVFKGALMIK